MPRRRPRLPNRRRARTAGQGSPWDSFVAARGQLAAGYGDEAVREHARDLVGVVVSVPVQHRHDVLAAYCDGSVRHVNFSGAAVVVDHAPASVGGAQREFLEQGRLLVNRIGSWAKPQLPPLPEGDAPLMVLTPSGPHFEQAPFPALGSDPMARPALDAAFRLLNAVLSAANDMPPTP
jgi:hypothetical protein